MSSTIASNAKKIKKHCEWSFNLRTDYASSDDSQSDSEKLDNKELTTTDTGTNRLLTIDDLDLSKRKESVAYKPNPFSIAKINAAHRLTHTVNGSSLQVAQPIRPVDKPTQTRQPTKRSYMDSGQTTIIEGFKTQAMKQPRTNALQRRLTANPRSSNSDSNVHKPITENMVVSVSPTKSTLSMATLLSTSAVQPVLASSCPVSTAMIPNTSNFSSTSSRFPEYAHILPLKASQPHDTQKLSSVSQSRAFVPAQLQHDMVRNQRKSSDNHHPAFSSFSSPSHPGPLDYDPRIRCSQNHSSPMQPVRENPFRPYSTFSPLLTRGKGLVPHFPNHFDTKRVSLRGSSFTAFSFPFSTILDLKGEHQRICLLLKINLTMLKN